MQWCINVYVYTHTIIAAIPGIYHVVVILVRSIGGMHYILKYYNIRIGLIYDEKLFSEIFM